MKLQTIRINGVLFYSHHTSNLYPGIWFKRYKAEQYCLVYSEILDGLAAAKIIRIGQQTIIIQLVEDIDFWSLVSSENTNMNYSQLKIAI